MVTTVDMLGMAAAAAIALAFYGVRQIHVYVGLTAGGVLLFATGTLVAGEVRLADWAVMSVGLAALSFGLLIVRVMLIRSVSLLLLGRLGGGATGDPFREDIRGRLDDMQKFRLIRTGVAGNRLTPFGRTIAAGVAACYALLRIRS